MAAGAVGAMHAAGVTLGSLSTGFADLMNLGISSSDPSSDLGNGVGTQDSGTLDPASRLQALGKHLFDELKKMGWPADKPLDLQLDATGRMSTSELPAELKTFVEQYLQEHPDYASHFEQLASELRRQYELPDVSGHGLSNNTTHGTWRFNLSDQQTKWNWSSV
jgi:hypothetical protein